MEKIRLTYIIDSLEIGGAEKLLVSYLRYLDKAAFEINVIYLKGEAKLLKNNPIEEVRIIGPLLKNEKNLILGIIRICRQLIRYPADIVHTHLFFANVCGRIASAVTGVPVVISTLHNPDYTYESNPGINFKIRKFLDRITGKMINTAFFAVSQAVKRDFEKNLGFTNIITLHNSVDVKEYDLQDDDFSAVKRGLGLNCKDRVILNVGRLHHQKGQSYLLEAFSALSTTHPDLKLLIAGNGPKENELKKQAEELGVKEKVLFLGKVEDIEKFYKISEVFVLPSLYEGFGMAMIEAMASGTPVVATAVDGVKEIARHSQEAFLVEPHSAEQIVEAVKELLENPQTAKRLVENAKLRVMHNFDVKVRAKEIERIYFSLAKERRCLVCGAIKSKQTLFGGYDYLGVKYAILRCKRCGFRFLSPLPEKNVLDAIYQNKEYFEHYYISEGKPASYIEAMHEHSKEDLAILKQIKTFKPKGELLDIGCAAGRFLLNAHNQGFEVFGVEPNSEQANYAKSCLKLNVVNGFFNRETFAGKKFDVIYLADTLEHLLEPKEILAAIREKLKDSGILVLKQPLTYNRSLFNLALGVKMRLRKPNDRYSNNPPTHLWEFNAASLKAFLSRAKWEISSFRVFENKPQIRGNFSSIIKYVSAIASGLVFLKYFALGDRAVAICKKRGA